MQKIKLNLKDAVFAHDTYSVAGQESEFIEWDGTCQSDAPTFYSHGEMFQQINTPPEKSFGWIFESKAFLLREYNTMRNRQFLDRFNKVFTHCPVLLREYPDKCLRIAGGGIWVGGSLGGGEAKIYEDKPLFCSMVSSDKRFCDAHRWRFNVATFLKDHYDDFKVDVFGLGNWNPIIDSLGKYKFSIIVENYIDDNYFTEKLLNCFATGTIPIYVGCTNIDKYFDLDGIIYLNKPEYIMEVIKIIGKNPEEEYNKRLSAIKDNFEVCKQYRSMEDFIWTNYQKYILT